MSDHWLIIQEFLAWSFGRVRHLPGFGHPEGSAVVFERVSAKSKGTGEANSFAQMLPEDLRGEARGQEARGGGGNDANVMN